MESLADFIGRFMKRRKPAKGYETARELKRRRNAKRSTA